MWRNAQSSPALHPAAELKNLHGNVLRLLLCSLDLLLAASLSDDESDSGDEPGMI